MPDKSIVFDHDIALSQAVKLDELAEQCKTQSKSMEKIIELMSDVWKGDSGDLMRSKCRAWNGRQLQIHQDLREGAKMLRKIQNEVFEVEERTKEQIKSGR